MSGAAGSEKGKKQSSPRPFPAITAQSYLPGSAAAAATGVSPYPGYIPPIGANQYPRMGPNPMEPPIMNVNTGTGLPPPSYNPMLPPMGTQPPISYSNLNPIQRPGPVYNRSFASYPRHRRRRRRIYRGYRSRRCRPIVRIVSSDSCSSISTCSTISSCSEYTTSQQQQPIIILPIQYPQQPSIAAPIQRQAQPIILPSTQIQQQPIVLPPISNISSAPMIMQSVNSIPVGKPQQFRAGPIQYVQAIPQTTSTSQLQFTPIAPERVLVNSTNNNQSTIVKTIQ
jgi:hypothetical protein